jgi:hypothetical protein
MGVNSSHLGSGLNVQTYVGNTSVDNAIIKSNDNNNDCWLMNWGDSAIWGIYNRNIDTTLTVGGAVDVKANSTAFIGGGLAKINLCHSDGSSNFNGNMILSGTGALTLPNGTTEQRPTAAAGMLRYNTTNSRPEYYNGTDWGIVADGSLFVAHKTSNQEPSSDTKLTYETATINRGNNYNTSNSRYTAPVTGAYAFGWKGWFNINTTGSIYVYLNKNGSIFTEQRLSIPTAAAEYVTFFPSWVFGLTAGDYIEVSGYGTNGNMHTSSSQRYSQFYGYLLH